MTTTRKSTRRKLTPVEEPQLREYSSHGVVQAVHAVRVDSGYEMQVRMSFAETPLLVYTQRGSPRSWASLDRLVNYVERTCPGVKGVTVDF